MTARTSTTPRKTQPRWRWAGSRRLQRAAAPVRPRAVGTPRGSDSEDHQTTAAAASRPLPRHDTRRPRQEGEECGLPSSRQRLEGHASTCGKPQATGGKHRVERRTRGQGTASPRARLTLNVPHHGLVCCLTIPGTSRLFSRTPLSIFLLFGSMASTGSIFTNSTSSKVIPPFPSHHSGRTTCPWTRRCLWTMISLEFWQRKQGQTAHREPDSHTAKDEGEPTLDLFSPCWNQILGLNCDWTNFFLLRSPHTHGLFLASLSSLPSSTFWVVHDTPNGLSLLPEMEPRGSKRGVFDRWVSRATWLLFLESN